jgi:hypothetical protein
MCELNICDDNFVGVLVDKKKYNFEFFDVFYVNEYSLKVFMRNFYFIETNFGEFLWEKIPYKIINDS